MIDPKKAGQDDCDDAVSNGADPFELVSPGQLGADEGLISAMGREWVTVTAAGGPNDSDTSWRRYGVPWCVAYNAAYLERARELARSAARDAAR